MHKLGIFAVASALISFGATATLAADCKIGSQQTLTGLMSEATDGGDGKWISPSVENAQPCSVKMLVGKGKVPPGCGFGEYFGKKRFAATGIVEDGLGPTLMVTSIRCSQ